MGGRILDAKTLLERKNLLEKRKQKEFEVEVKDLGVFKLRTPTTADLIDAREYGGGDYENEFIVYTCTVEPNLKSQELQQGFEVKDPVDIVNEIFLPGEVAELATILVKSAGFNNEVAKVVDDTKN